MVDVICVGASVLDIPLQPVNKEVFDCESYPLQQINMAIGGDALNESTIISRLGHKVSLLSMVGKDVAGYYIVDHCMKNKIDTIGIKQREDVDTSINIGLVTEDGERTFITNRNGSLWKTTIDDIDLSLVKNAKLLSYGSFFNNPLLKDKELVKLFKKAKKENMIISADMIKPRNNETFEDIKESLSYVDYFFPNFDEASLMTGKDKIEDVADEILSYGVGCVIIKIGSKGVYIKSKNGYQKIVPALKGITPIDTIGAGDNFASGFITGLLEDKSLEECGKIANVTAAISIQSVGATTGVKNRKQVDDVIKKYNEQRRVND
ncbi:carbohydrate kinase family protein [Anaerococcus rubeinfantis]|uniref:carbohydrate kinase family protein n=1 Tax=Anaerococcus rubeinfantis TaxID=1720199 RepID=UPI00073E12A2|nr:carbohydrate kinase family protein [Anaerococcus rubeinfantis]